MGSRGLADFPFASDKNITLMQYMVEFQLVTVKLINTF